MTEPRIAVDLRILDRAGMERTGLGRQALETSRALREVRPDWRLTLLSNRPELLGGIEAEIVPTRWPTSSGLGRVAWLAAGGTSRLTPKPDAWLGLSFMLPRRWTGPGVVVVHDLVFTLRPDLYRGSLNAAYAQRSVRESARRADRIICGSTATATRAVRHFGVDPARIRVAFWGVAEPFRKPIQAGPGEGGFLLFVGRWEARKGLDVLGAALQQLRAGGTPPRLVLAGGPGWRSEDALAALLDMPEVEIVRNPSDQRLAELYSKALALVYPSRMEGFALPVAEAMACGCPVIASDLEEIREWARDGPAYVPPGSPEALARTITAVSDPERCRAMAARGREIAATLNWARAGSATAEALEEAIAERREPIGAASAAQRSERRTSS